MALKITPADQWFSRCIREAAAWKCERCHRQHEEKSQGLHCAHYMSRGNWSTRFDPDNAAALCYGCHSFLDRHPYEKSAWFEQRLGDGMVDIIREKASTPARGIKKYKKEIAKHYREELKRLQQERLNGETGKLEIIGWM